MSDIKHTPGPWRETTDTTGVEICTIHCCSPRSTALPEAQRWLYIIAARSIHRGEAEQDANARLIAAAPELYAALMGILQADGRWHDYIDASVIASAEEAIAKAEGAS